MSKICTIDTSHVDEILDRLNEDSRRKAIYNSLIKGSKVLVEETQNSLRNALPKANSKMIEGVKTSKNKNYDEVKVHIMGDFRLKFFEMGTDERYLKKPLKSKTGNTKKKDNSGKNPYRGKIIAKEFFRKARQSSNMLDEVMENLIKEINKLMK